MNIKPGFRQKVSVFIDTMYEKTEGISEDIIISGDLQDAISESVIWLELPQLHELLEEFGFSGTQIKGSPEKLWKMKLKG